jgi:probable phosphoglycerate mutase
VSYNLYLARHGATEWSENGRHTGLTDLPLLPEGEEEARDLGPVLAALGIKTAFVSDRARSRRTAELAGFPNAIVTPLLREADYGDYEGLTSEQIHVTRPGWEIYHDGCPGGESPDQLYARCHAALALLDGRPGPAVFFSHGHFLRALATAWTNVGITVATHLMLGTATLCRLADGDHGRVIDERNLPLSASGVGQPSGQTAATLKA